MNNLYNELEKSTEFFPSYLLLEENPPLNNKKDISSAVVEVPLLDTNSITLQETRKYKVVNISGDCPSPQWKPFKDKEKTVIMYLVRCNRRTCPECQRALSMEIFHRIKPVVKEVLNNKKNYDKMYSVSPEYTLKLMTLTFKPSYNKYNDIKSLKVWINRLWRNRLKAICKGAVITIEFSENLNIHVHALIYSRYIAQRLLCQWWSEITDNRGLVCDIRAVNNLGGVCEVLKYSSKLDGLSLEKKCIIESALKGSRRIILKGLFYSRIKEPFVNGLPKGLIPLRGLEYFEVMELINSNRSYLYDQIGRNDLNSS